MFRQLTISDIITYAFDKGYTMEQAATDLGELMMEPELTKRRHGTDAPRFTELKTLIPIQERLALGKLRGDEVFEQVAQLDIRLEQYD